MSESTLIENNTSTSSVKLNISTKGVTTFEVKVYDANPDEALKKAQEIYVKLKDRYVLELGE